MLFNPGMNGCMASEHGTEAEQRTPVVLQNLLILIWKKRAMGQQHNPRKSAISVESVCHQTKSKKANQASINLKASPSNSPRSLSLRCGITSSAMKESVMNGARSCEPSSFARVSSSA